jgi:hypothetical protein
MMVPRTLEPTMMKQTMMFEERLPQIKTRLSQIKELDLDISRSAVTPAGKELFNINENAKLLPPATAESFDGVTAKLLYMSIYAQMDLLFATRHDLFYNSRVQ